MSRGAQASIGGKRSRTAIVLAGLVSAALLGGCASGGLSLETAAADPTIVTGAVDGAAPGDATGSVSDESTIRNAVSSADVEMRKGAPLSWANAETGSRGEISALAEDKRAGDLCRTFTTSRESFDGVALFQGRACMVAPGAWRMEEFKPL